MLVVGKIWTAVFAIITFPVKMHTASSTRSSATIFVATRAFLYTVLRHMITADYFCAHFTPMLIAFLSSFARLGRLLAIAACRRHPAATLTYVFS
jgi:hypothetical protein